MADKDVYKGLTPQKQEEYEGEIAQKYGDEVVQETQRKVGEWSADDWGRAQDELASIHAEIAKFIDQGPACAEVQVQIARHRAWLNKFYECGAERHLGVADFYRSHPDFVENYKKFLGYEQGAEFMYQAIKFYCEQEAKQKQEEGMRHVRIGG